MWIKSSLTKIKQRRQTIAQIKQVTALAKHVVNSRQTTKVMEVINTNANEN